MKKEPGEPKQATKEQKERSDEIKAKLEKIPVKDRAKMIPLLWTAANKKPSATAAERQERLARIARIKRTGKPAETPIG